MRSDSFTTLLSPIFDSATIPRTLTQILWNSRSEVGKWARGQLRNWSKNRFLNLGNPLLELGGGSFSENGLLNLGGGVSGPL